MALITKAALANLLNISSARVSQYAGLGLPVRSDGKLNLDDALKWIAANIPLSDDPNKGSAKAQQLVQHGLKRRAGPHSDTTKFSKAPVPWLQPCHDTDNAFDAGALFMMLHMARDLQALASIAAYDAGTGEEKAKEIADRMFCVFAERGAAIMTEHGIGPFARDPDAPIWPTEPGMRVDWDKLRKVDA